MEKMDEKLSLRSRGLGRGLGGCPTGKNNFHKKLGGKIDHCFKWHGCLSYQGDPHAESISLKSTGIVVEMVIRLVALYERFRIDCWAILNHVIAVAWFHVLGVAESIFRVCVLWRFDSLLCFWRSQACDSGLIEFTILNQAVQGRPWTSKIAVLNRRVFGNASSLDSARIRDSAPLRSGARS